MYPRVYFSNLERVQGKVMEYLKIYIKIFVFSRKTQILNTCVVTITSDVPAMIS